MSIIATAVILAFIVLLFRLARDESRASWALWIPILWFGIICSRPISNWIHPDQGTDYMDRFTEGSPLDATIYGFLILAALLVLNRRADRVKSFLQANLPIVLFFAYCAVSVVWSDDPMVATKRLVKAIGDFGMVLVVLSDADSETAVKRMYTYTGFVLLPMSVLLILFFPSLGTSYNVSDHVTMYTGVATFKNLLGVMCMACGLGALWSLISAWQDREMPNRKRHLVAYGITVLLALGLLVRSDSMTSFSSFALAGMVMAVSATPLAKRRPGVLLAAVLFAVGIAGFALFMDSGGSLLENIGRNPTLTGRTMIWRAVLAQHINPLIGAGFESFWMGDRMQSVWSMSQVGIQQAHDGYLELYLNLGWIGIALLGLMIVTGYRNGFLLYMRDPTAGRLRIAVLTAAVVFGFTEAGYRMMSPDWTGFLVAVTALPWALAGKTQVDVSFVRLRPKAQSEMRILQ
ncbi:MAG TPA: O-antigen ligase family protein [Terracidiphilus sp.]|nr:O-antigen ligase family protein [Terracidiphilus sp.]